MSDAASEVLDAAMRLPELERARLATILADSVGDGVAQEQLDAAALAEAKRRLARLDSGETEAVSYEAIKRKLHESVERARRRASAG